MLGGRVERVAELRDGLPGEGPDELHPAHPHDTGERLDHDVGGQVALAEGGDDGVPVGDLFRKRPTGDRHQERGDADDDAGEQDSGGDPAGGAHAQPASSWPVTPRRAVAVAVPTTEPGNPGDGKAYTTGAVTVTVTVTPSTVTLPW